MTVLHQVRNVKYSNAVVVTKIGADKLSIGYYSSFSNRRIGLENVGYYLFIFKNEFRTKTLKYYFYETVTEI